MAGGFRPFDHGAPPWAGASPFREPLVLDAWRHRHVDGGGGPGAGLEGVALDAALCSLRGGAAGAASADSTAASIGDLRLSQGSGLGFAPLPRGGATSPGPGLAEPSERRREALRGAWRRLDPRGRGAVEAREAALALQGVSHLQPEEQERLVQALCEAAGGERVTHAAFAAYYRQLGAAVERDRDFEDLMRHHWGFAEVSDLLDDMKNKFAVVGLAYAFRQCLEQGAPELSLEGFSESVVRLGMSYSGAEVRRLFDAFGPPGGQPGLQRSLEVHRLMQQLTSAPRPSTPVPAFHSGAQAAVGEQLAAAQPPAALGAGSREAAVPPTVPAPEEGGAWAMAEVHAPLPMAPAEGEDGEDDVPPAPRELPAATAARPPEAPPEDDDGEAAPEERPPERGAEDEPPRAPEERAGPPAARAPQTQAAPAGAAAPRPAPQLPAAQQHRAQQQMAPPRPARAPAPDAGHRAAAAAPCLPAPPAGHRRAVTVGVSYEKLPCRLEGSINDSDAFITLLTEDFGYDVADIRQLRDDHPQRMPTRRNINAALRWLVNGAKPGDHLLFHYSGLGSQQPGPGEGDMSGRDESLVPCDYQQSGTISDDELRRALAQGLPRGARLTVLLDCCRAGAALDLPYRFTLRGDSELVDLDRQARPVLPTPPGEGEVVVLSTRRCPAAGAGGAAPGAAAAAAAAPGAASTAFRAAIRRSPEGSFHVVLAEMRRFLAAHGAAQEPQLSCERCPRLAECFLPEARPAPAPRAAPARPPVRKALTVGADYLALWPGQGRLAGCVGDSEAVVGALRGVFGFEDAQIVQLRDDRPEVLPTRANLLASLQWLAQGAQAGDELFLHFSGHGDEGQLLPCDFHAAGPLTAEELRQALVAPLPAGCRLWAVLDGRGGGPPLGRCRAAAAPDGRALRLDLGAPGGAAAPGAEVIALSSGAEEAGAGAPAAALTAAFVQAVSPEASCEELLLRTRQLLRRAGSSQEPQLSSEWPVQLDSGFLGYAAGRGAAAPAAAPAPAPAPAAAPAAPASPAAPAPAPASPVPHAPLRGAAALDVDTGAYVMDSRINRLEQQIAQLRRQQRSPAPLSPVGGPAAGGLGAHAGSWGQVPRVGGAYG